MIYSIIQNIPTISYQFPSLPGSEAYGIIGGTLHSTSLIEFKDLVSSVFNKNKSTLDYYSKKRKKFLIDVLGLDEVRIKNGITSSRIIEREILMKS